MSGRDDTTEASQADNSGGSCIAPRAPESDRPALDRVANASAPSRDAMLALYL